MIVKDWMSSPAVTAVPTTPTEEALHTMRARKIHRLPVVLEQGTLVGIVTRRDLLERGQPGTPVGSLMSAPPYTTTPAESLAAAARLMRTRGIGGLPVLDRGQLVGIITESDIFDAFLELLGERGGARIVVPLDRIADGVAKVL